MEKLKVIFKNESYNNGIYYYECAFENLEVKDLVSNCDNIEIEDLSTLNNIKAQLLIDCGNILFFHLQENFPDIAIKYEL